MKQLFIATASITLLLGISGCKSTSKADSANPPPNSRANESVLEHMGNDAGTVIKSTGDVIGGAVDAIGKGGATVIDSFKSDKDKGKSNHPDHPN
jgi:hypothetical protein